MAEGDQEKRHEPSEKKWREAAEQGQIPKSQDLQAAAVILSGAAALAFASNSMGRSMREVSAFALNIEGVKAIGMSDAFEIGEVVITTVAAAIAMPIGAVLVATLVVGAAQSQFKFASKVLEPKWERVDPVGNFKSRYASWTPLVELGKSLLKLFAIGAVTAWALYGEIETLPTLAVMTPEQSLDHIVALAWKMVIAATPIILIVAAADYAYSYYQLYQQVKRTDQEVKEEGKEQQGDPQLRAKRKQRAREIAVSQSLARLPEADVVITNPTHYAVALRYERGVDAAPIVVAKGVDHLALRIRTEAWKLGIPRVENRPLARALFAEAKVGAPINAEHFGPVAQVLAVVYRRRAQRNA